MRAAIIHYWLLNMRGGEKVLEAICRLLPDADIFTLFYDPASVSPEIRSRRITTSVPPTAAATPPVHASGDADGA